MKNISIYANVFLVSFCILFLELVYPKILQFVQLKGFEYLILAISMLGIGFGGLYSFLTKKKIETIPIFSIFLGFSIILSFFIVILIPNFYLSIFMLSIPFFFFSVIVSITFVHFPSNIVYAISLLGSGMGIIGVFYLFRPLGGENCILLMCMISFLGGLGSAYFYRKDSYLSISCLTLLLCLTFVFSLNIRLDFLNLIKVMSMRHPKILDTPIRIGSDVIKRGEGELLASKWDLISRVDVIRERHNFWRSAMGESFIKRSANAKIQDTFRDIMAPDENINLYYSNVLFTFVPPKPNMIYKMPPYTLLKAPKVLIIGPGGGIDIAWAKYNYASRIVGVEINPSTVRLMENELKDFSKNIYSYAEIETMDGRTYVYLSKEKFDLINLMFAELYIPFPHSNVYIENYLYTVEAFEGYLNHLTDNGFLFINKWIGGGRTPSELLRITAIAMEALDRLKVSSPERHITVWGYFMKGQANWGGGILIKKSPFTTGEIDAIKFSIKKPFELIYVPGTKNYSNSFSTLILSDNRETFYQSFPHLDYTPSTDDKPFLYIFDKEHKLQKVCFLIIATISSVAVLLPLGLIAIINRKSRNYKFLIICLFFSFLAIAYMLLEIVMIQKFNIFLGSPIHSMAVVISVLLIFGGIGSYLSTRLSSKRSALYAIAAIPILLILYYFFLPNLLELLTFKELSNRILVATMLLCPASFLMGIPFPLALDTVKKKWSEIYSAMMYAIDGTFSVIAAVFSILFTVIYGFKALFILAILLYFIVFFIFVYINRVY